MACGMIEYDWSAPKGWEEYFSEEIIKIIREFIDEECMKGVVYPKNDLFRAFRGLEPDDVKVVIIGQDPYHQSGQANGLAFGISSECEKVPPSLKNIVKELLNEGYLLERSSYDLEDWKRQGVLLMNMSLSVVESKPESHMKFWQAITNGLIRFMANHKKRKVFMLWGNYARKKSHMIKRPLNGHLILESAHPSPLSAHRGFFGNNHFQSANKFLLSKGIDPVQWGIPVPDDDPIPCPDVHL